MTGTRTQWESPEVRELKLDEVLDVAEMRLAFATSSCCSMCDCDVVSVE